MIRPLELRAGTALIEVDKVLRQQPMHPLPRPAVRELLLLEKHVQDLVILLCSRFICKTILQSEGIPWELLVRLAAALPASEPLLSILEQQRKEYFFGQGVSRMAPPSPSRPSVSGCVFQ